MELYITPRQVAQQLTRMNTRRARAWILDMFDALSIEFRGRERTDCTSIIEKVAKYLAGGLGMELTDPVPAGVDDTDIIEIWYTRGFNDGEDGMAPEPWAYKDYPK